MLKILPVVLFVFVLVIPCLAQDGCSDGIYKTISGKITYVDWVNSTLSVRYLQRNGSFDQMLFAIPDDAQIRKGIDTISSSNLNIGDDVTIKYCDPGLTNLRAMSISVGGF